MANEKKSGKKSASKKQPNNSKLSVKDKNYNLVKIKSSSLNVITISIIVVLILIVILGYIIYYLNSLKSCDCFIENNEKNKANIDYLIIIESLGLAINIIILINLISTYIAVNKIKSGGGNTTFILTYIILTVVNLLIYGYFVYNIYLLSKNIDPSCECAVNPVRYLLYIQGIFTFISLIMSVLGIFFVLRK